MLCSAIMGAYNPSTYSILASRFRKKTGESGSNQEGFERGATGGRDKP
jgi:hypothetical protein